MEKLSAPLSVTFAITGRCNLRCKHCSVLQSWGKKEMPTNKMLKIIDQLGKAKVFTVDIFGGEPLMRKDLPVLLKRFRKYPINLSMNTNATLMSLKTAEFLIKEMKIRSYCVSIDGTREIHESQRGKGSFDAAIAGIKNIHKFGGNVLLSFTVTKLNIGNLKEVVKLGKEIGVNSVRFNHVFYVGNAACYLKDIFVSPAEERKAIKEIVRLSSEYPGFITGSYLGQDLKLKNISTYEIQTKEIKVAPCGAGTNRCAIKPDGVVTPCEIIWELDAGNLHNDTFNDIWKNSEVLSTFRKEMKVDVSKMPECARCKYQYLCFTGHRCYPYYFPGGIDNKGLYCWTKEN